MDQERSIIRELLGWIVYILIIVGLTYVIITFVGQRTRVSGSSMETTLSDGDNLIVDKISFRFREPRRYEIIVFPYQYEEDTYYIKRIIGLPGETVQVMGGRVYVDGEELDEHYGNEEMLDPGIAENPRMRILCWGTTGTTAQTAVMPVWEYSTEKICWEERGSVYGH